MSMCNLHYSDMVGGSYAIAFHNMYFSEIKRVRKPCWQIQNDDLVLCVVILGFSLSQSHT